MTVRAGYLTSGDERLLCLLHPAAGHDAPDVGVLVCAPLGFREVASYRALHEWAQRLAADGRAALRFHRPGDGDSTDGAGFTAWVTATGDAAHALRALTGCRRVVALGIGLGGMLAVAAAARGAPIDDLVLWATPARGRAFVRELEALAQMEAQRMIDGGAPPPPPGDELAPGGFALTGELVEELRAVDLSAVELDGEGRRALLLGRDGVKPDRRLVARLAECGVAVTTGRGDGFGAMLEPPDQARVPEATIREVAGWLAAPAPGTRAAPPAAPVELADELSLVVDGVAIAERPVWVPVAGGRLFGIVAAPRDAGEADVACLLLNAGAISRVGPNRMWVALARRWAARGIPTVRLDLEGIGDAEGEPTRLAELASYYDGSMVDSVTEALDVLRDEAGLPDRVVAAGLCSGAYHAFHATLRDPRFVAALMVNPRALYWDPGLEVRRELRRVRLLSRGVTWRRLLRGEVKPRRVWRLVADSARKLWSRSATGGDGYHCEEIAAAFDELERGGRSARFVFCDGEPLRDELEAARLLPPPPRWSRVGLTLLAGRDHTLRPPWMQAAAHEALDRALEEELARLPPLPARR